MPASLDARDVYAADRPGHLSPAVHGFPDRIYVPNSGRNTVDVIDPQTFTIVGHFRVGRQPQHVTPSYDLKTLWVLNDLGDSLTRVDPRTGGALETLKVKDPLQPVFHARWPIGDHRSRAHASVGLPRRADDETRRLSPRAVPGRRSHGLLRRWPIPGRIV